MSKGFTFQTLDPQEGTGFGLGLRVSGLSRGVGDRFG